MGRLRRTVEDDILPLHHIGDEGLVGHAAAHEADPVPNATQVGGSGLELRIKEIEHGDLVGGILQAAQSEICPEKSGPADDQDVHEVSISIGCMSTLRNVSFEIKETVTGRFRDPTTLASVQLPLRV